MPPRILKGRKLLVASIGVASVSYVTGCSAFSDPDRTATSGNLMARPPIGQDPLPPTSGNLVGPPEVPPPPTVTPPVDPGPPPTSGNLVSPPVIEEDAGTDADAG